MPFVRFRRAFGLAVSISVLLSLGCRRDPSAFFSDVPPGPPVEGDAFVAASLGDASRLNPVLATDSASGEINGLVFSGLLKYDENLNIVGDLAESYEVRRGGREILFRLRKGLLWHDGVPVTSDDVLFTYEKLIDPNVRTPYGADYIRVEKVETPDPLTLRVLYKEPFAPALESWMKGILPRHVYGAGDFNSHPANRAPVGCGPYRFVEWVADQKIVLEANPGYFEGKPYISRYIFRVVPDDAVQFLELRNESIDGMGLTPDQYKAYGGFFTRHRRYRYPSFAYTYLGFNLTRPLFQDRRVREAFAHAILKSELIDGVLLGMGTPATGPFPPRSWAYSPDVKDYAHDPEKARALFAEAGWSDTDGDGWLDKDGAPFSFTVITNQGNKLRELTAVILQDRLAKVGVKMKVRIVEWSAFIHNFVDTGDFDAVILGWNTGVDPDQFIIWHSSQRGAGKYNFVGYDNPEADLLLVEGQREFNPEKRKEIYQRLHRLLHHDLPYLFLYSPESLPVVHKRFVGVTPTANGIYWNFNKWYVPAAWRKYRA